LSKIAYKKRKRDEEIKAALVETQTDIQGLQTSQSMQTSTLHSKEYLSVQEVANLIGTSRWTIQRMIQREQLKAAKFTMAAFAESVNKYLSFNEYKVLHGK